MRAKICVKREENNFFINVSEIRHASLRNVVL